MEHKNEAFAARSTLLLLNEDCLLDIFELLEFDDSINLARTCSRLRAVAHRTFKKISKFQLDSRIVNKGEPYIENIFFFIGQHLTSLTLQWYGDYVNLNKLLGKIINDCKNVKCIGITNCREQRSKNISTAYSFDNVEVLTLRKCNFYFAKSFFENFHNLKSLNISCCSIETNLLKTIIQNNPSIESFVYSNSSNDFVYQLFELFTNVERLSLAAYDSGNIAKLDSLLKLNRLTKLRLNCRMANINNFLKELAKKGILEDMELNYVHVDDHDFFDILTSFDKLQSLGIKTVFRGTNLTSPIFWPTKLRCLRLEYFELTHIALIDIIEQLKCIESIDIQACYIADGDKTHFKDVTKLSQQILQIIDNSSRKQRLDLVLPRFIEPSVKDRHKKYLIDSEHLRILHLPGFNEKNPLGIKIHFPGY